VFGAYDAEGGASTTRRCCSSPTARGAPGHGHGEQP
jgi:hypothetical protein